jgi:transcriptional regulator with XRE-family HTH domain
MSCNCIDGVKFRILLAERGIKQRKLAAAIGMTHHNISRWCSQGKHSVKGTNLIAVAQCLSMTYEELIDRVGVGVPEFDSEMTPAETEWLEIYRSLTPLEQAKMRLSIEDLMKKHSAKA